MKEAKLRQKYSFNGDFLEFAIEKITSLSCNISTINIEKLNYT